jgi:hypothetical protein
MAENRMVEERIQTDSAKSDVPFSRESRRYSSRSSNSRSVKKIFKLKIIVAVLSVALMVTAFGWIAISMKLAGVEEQFQQFRISSHQEISDSENRVAEIERLKAEKEILVKGFIPGLSPLEFDSTIDVDDQYVRNIGFTLTGTSHVKNYEYRIVLHNDSLNVVAPSVTVILFDDRGIQVGTTVLSKIDATSKVEFNSLQPNETRSYTGRIGLNIQSEPKYFLIQVK